ncbi:hypothetical protein D210916BOD24_16080 [Alteromonas sp. D210916BOD_24]
MSSKSRHCPSCNWKFPIAKVKAPITRVNGTFFNCPECYAPLIYKTNHATLYRVCTILTVPSVLLISAYKDVEVVKNIATFVVIPLLIALCVMWRKGEHIEYYKP